MTPPQDIVVVATGLQFEAGIAAGAGVDVVCRQNTTLASYLEKRIAQGCAGLVSFGTVGGLVDGLRPGDWVIAQAVIDGGARMLCDAGWSQALLRALPNASHVEIAGETAPVATRMAKRALHSTSGASAADMESQIVARAAQVHGLPFVCCRVVIDSVERSLPDAALAGMREDGSLDIFAVLRSLLGNPAQLPALLGIARDAGIARRALAQGRQKIGNGFAFAQRG